MTDLDTELLMASPFEPDDDKIVRQLHLLSEEIDRCEREGVEGSPRYGYLCGQYQALMWARSPNAYEPPMEEVERR